MSAFVDFRLRQSVQVLQAGGVVACATESVWGLSCDPWVESAVARILALKGRSPAKGLILVAGEEAQLEFLLHDLAPALRSKLRMSWPGANTWLVPHCGRVPELVHGQSDRVAVRVCGHPRLRDLCLAFGAPLVSTSANRSGGSPARTRLEIQRSFGPLVDDVLPGKVGGRENPSTIRDVFTDEVVRA